MATLTADETVDEMAIKWLEQNGEDFNTFTLRDMLKVYCAGYSRRGRDIHAELMEILAELNVLRNKELVFGDFDKGIRIGLTGAIERIEPLRDKYAPANGATPSAGQQADHSL